jgi:hypothetical protein
MYINVLVVFIRAGFALRQRGENSRIETTNSRLMFFVTIYFLDVYLLYKSHDIPLLPVLNIRLLNKIGKCSM